MAVSDKNSPPAVAGDALLQVCSVSLRFGGVQALDNVTFSIAKRSRSGLIGPNGAGKTTLFNCVSRLVDFQSGQIIFDGHDVGAMPSHGIHAVGVARTFQGVGLVPTMTVLENVMVGAGKAGRHGFALSSLILSEVSTLDQKVRARALDTLKQLNLAHLADETPPHLPFGTQKRIELARALIGQPKLLMLDEPANGLTSSEVDELRDLLLRIWQDSDMTLLVVEHHMGLVMSVCDDIVVLDAGKLLARGAPKDIRANPDVIRAYLGGRNKAATA